MGSEPHRVQLSRKKGWRMPENTVSVARPTIHGNPYRVGQHGDAAACVAQFRRELEFQMGVPGASYVTIGRIRSLRGKNLACWCPLDQPCHADVLLELANKDTPDADT